MNTINNLKEYQEDKENGISYFKRNVNKSKERWICGRSIKRREYGDGQSNYCSSRRTESACYDPDHPFYCKIRNSATYAAIVKAEAEKASVPVCMHLDHGSSYELAEECIGNGYTSVMIDGSKEDFENNIAVSKKVVEMAHAKGIPVEAELEKLAEKKMIW